jgi:hypothetical protein
MACPLATPTSVGFGPINATTDISVSRHDLNPSDTTSHNCACSLLENPGEPKNPSDRVRKRPRAALELRRLPS